MRYHFLRFPGGKPKAVTLSYDDGVCYDIQLAQTCNRYGVKCTFNINTASIAQKSGGYKLTGEEIQEHILDAGHEVAIHGHIHKAPGLCSAAEGIKEFLDCRVALESRYGRIVRGMAYPDIGINRMENGAAYENIRRYLRDLGVAYARGVDGDNNRFRLPDDWYAWYPTAHHENPNVLEWAAQFVKLKPNEGYVASRGARLFYLWGHSYEFNNNGNWERLDAILEILSGQEDTWYATNIEIREYVQAYESLVFSASADRVYNPTNTAVWFFADDQLYTVHPGQEVTIA